MECKYCGQTVECTDQFCPHCGKDLRQTDAPETVTEETAAAQSVTEETAAEETVNGAETAAEETVDAAQSAASEAPAVSEKKNGTLICVVAGLLALVAALLILLVPRLKNASDPAETPTDGADLTLTDEMFSDLAGTLNDADTDTVVPEVSYTVEEAALTEDVLAQVIATCGSEQMTNRELTYYYWNQYYSFANTYGMYLSYLLDTATPLDQQMYDETQTWQQMFMDGGVEMFHSMSAVSQEAEKAGFTLTAAREAELSALADTCTQGAEYYGYADGDAYIQSVFGPTATVEGYLAFCRKLLLCTDYLQSCVDALEYTDADIEAYYDENAESYGQYVQKIDKPMVTIRHILLQPEETNDDGEYTDAAWSAAEQKAQEVLQEWESGERSEERFGELAAQYSADGNASSGGIYEDVYPGQMVTEFNDWCFDDARVPGDYGLVRTEYGYHIIYFSAASDEIYWFETAKSDYLQTRSTELEQSMAAAYDFNCDLTNAAVFDVLMAQNEAAEQDAAAAAEE